MNNKPSAIMDHKLMVVLLVGLVIILSIVAIKSSNDNDSLKSFERNITQVETTSTSDETLEIEKDLNNTDLNNLDAELKLIETELN